jgi:transcription-repair coupling factor (superfamily II helicase)
LNDLSNWLLRWKLFSEKAASTGFTSQPAVQSTLANASSVAGNLDVWALSSATPGMFAEIFGFVKQARQIRPKPTQNRGLLPDLSPGDYAVHVDHGIGRFVGMKKISLDQAEREYLTLEYAAGDVLYVPTDQIDRVSRYIGATDKPPALSRLGTQEWNRTKQKVKESVAEIARDLLQLYATREVLPGFAYSPDTVWQQELEAAFPYVETPDQIKAIDEVYSDMESERPMDRLVCGDVGFGKTEVAVRAAFKAVMDAKQAALLVPTTVLAEQHYETFRKRMDLTRLKWPCSAVLRVRLNRRRSLPGQDPER